MNRGAAAGMVAVLGILIALLQREEARGTFDGIERAYLSWLVSNSEARLPLPPMTLVLYDEEASSLAGEGRLGVLDGALFARAASRLGAVAAGIEGVSGDAVRMAEAARGTRVFGGYDREKPPATGWTPVRGEPGASWQEVPGLVGRPGRFARGFIPPASEMVGAREFALAGANSGRAVPSFLILAWAAAQGARVTDLVVASGALAGPAGKLPLSPKGTAGFFPGDAPGRTSMNEVLVESERLERMGGESPLRGHVLVLVQATPDVTRVAGAGFAPALPADVWARAWDALRRGHVFLSPGVWYGPVLLVMACTLAFGSARRRNTSAVLAGVFTACLYLFAALAAFAGESVFLPLVPGLLTIAAGLVAGRIGHESGWLGP